MRIPTLSNRISLAVLPLFVALSGCASSAPSASTVPSGPSLVGGWKSSCVPSGDTQSSSLDFDIQADTWSVDYVVYGDKACSAKFLTVHIDGAYEVDGSSTVVPTANDAIFRFSHKLITPASDAAAQFLSSDAGCKLPGFVSGTAKDVSETGCANLGQYPIAKCGADYDLVKVDADAVTFGLRPADNDMCTAEKRPKALSPVSSKRK